MKESSPLPLESKKEGFNLLPTVILASLHHESEWYGNYSGIMISLTM